MNIKNHKRANRLTLDTAPINICFQDPFDISIRGQARVFLLKTASLKI